MTTEEEACDACLYGDHENCYDNVDFPCYCCGVEWPQVLRQWDREVKADLESKGRPDK